MWGNRYVIYRDGNPITYSAGKGKKNFFFPLPAVIFLPQGREQNMDLFDLIDVLAVHAKIMDLYRYAMDFNDSITGLPKFTARTRKMIHEISIMCNNSKFISSARKNKRADLYFKGKEPEDILMDMVTAVTKGIEEKDKAAQYMIPMICIPMIDGMLQKRDLK